MTGRLWAIALNTFRENRRDRILYVLLLFAVLMIIAGIAVSELSPFEQPKILLDLGQASMFLVGSLIAILLGAGLVSKEIERRTIYVIVSKPVGRGEFLVGKVLGLAITLTAATAVMAVILLAVTSLYGQPPTLALGQSIVLLWCQLTLLVCLAVAFASFVSSTTLAVMFSFSCWILGQVAEDLDVLARRIESPAVAGLLRAFYWLLPNLSLLDAKVRGTYGVPVPAAEFFSAIGYAVAYSVMLLAFASLAISRRDFR